MSISTARKTLNRARMELHHARDEEDMRQAAEKGWRAAREAVYAVVEAVKKRPHGTVSPSFVADFEAKHLGDASGSGPLCGGYASALHVLHGECFYDGVVKSREEMALALKGVGGLINDADYALIKLRSGSVPRARGRRKR